MRIGHGQTALIVLLALVLLVLGVWDTAIYREYRLAVDSYFQTRNVAAAASQLELIVAREPRMPIYLATLAYWQRSAGKLDSAAQTINTLCAIEPDYQPPPNDNQIAILHYLRFSPLRLPDGFFSKPVCQPLP